MYVTLYLFIYIFFHNKEKKNFIIYYNSFFHCLLFSFSILLFVYIQNRSYFIYKYLYMKKEKKTNNNIFYVLKRLDVWSVWNYYFLYYIDYILVDKLPPIFFYFGLLENSNLYIYILKIILNIIDCCWSWSWSLLSL